MVQYNGDTERKSKLSRCNLVEIYYNLQINKSMKQLIKNIQQFFFLKKHGLPKTIKKVWYNGSWNMISQTYPKLFSHWGQYINCKVGLITTMQLTKDGKEAKYEVVKMRKLSGSDWRHAFDAIECDFKFHHIEK